MSRFARQLVPALAVAATLAGAACGTTVSTSTVRQTTPVAGGSGLDVPAAGSPSPASSRVSGARGRAAATGTVSAQPTRGAPAAPVAAVPSVAAPTTGPVKVGILYAVNDGAAPAGINNGNTFTPDRVVHALVDSYNKSGGIAGRHIEPVYAALHSYNDDYEAQIAAACATFTQDNHVAVVLTNAGYYSEQLLSCLSKASVPLISGDYAGADRHDAATYPGFVAPTTLLGEDREASVVAHLAASAWLTRSNRVGVIIENCAIDKRVYEHGLAPALARAGVPVASTFETQCFQSIQDFGAETSQMSNAVVQFRSRNVDRVMVVSAAAEANLVFAFSEVADSQHWYPGYALSSVAIPEALAQNAAPTQMAHMRGVGWLPVLDSEDPQQDQPDAAARDCLARVRSEGVQPQSNTDDAFVYEPCDTFRLLDAMARATNGDVSLAGVLRGERSVAGSFRSAITEDGAERLWRGSTLAPATGREFAFLNGRFRYIGKSFAL